MNSFFPSKKSSRTPDIIYCHSAPRAPHQLMLGIYLLSFLLTQVISWITRTEMRIQQLIRHARWISDGFLLLDIGRPCPYSAGRRLKMLLHPCQASECTMFSLKVLRSSALYPSLGSQLPSTLRSSSAISLLIARTATANFHFQIRNW